CGTHRLFTSAGTVITHVALHHQVISFVLLRNSERTCHDAVRAADTPGGICSMYHSKLIFGDGVGGTNVRTGWIVTMHTNLHGCLDSDCPVNIVDVDHRFVAIGFAFGASHFAGFAPDATLHIYKELLVGTIIRYRHMYFVYGRIECIN